MLYVSQQSVKTSKKEQEVQLTESLTLQLPSEQDEENLIGAFQQPHKYVIGLVIIPQNFKPPYSLAFDGRGSARLCIKVIEAFSYPQNNRYNILNKLVKETSELKFETFRALHESIYDPKESPHNFPLLAAYRFKKSGRIEVIDLKQNVKDQSELQFLARVPPLVIFWLLKAAFCDSYQVPLAEAVYSSGDAIKNYKLQSDFHIRQPIITSGLDTTHPLVNKGLVLTKHTVWPLEVGLTGVYRYSREGSRPILYTDRRISLTEADSGWCLFHEYTPSPNSKAIESQPASDEHTPPGAPHPISVEIFYDEEGVKNIIISQNDQHVEALRFKNPLEPPVKFFWNPLSKIYYQLGKWVGNQIRVQLETT